MMSARMMAIVPLAAVLSACAMLPPEQPRQLSEQQQAAADHCWTEAQSVAAVSVTPSDVPGEYYSASQRQELMEVERDLVAAELAEECIASLPQ